MEKIIKEYEVYKYSELDKNIQEELLEKQINIEVDSYCECFLGIDMQEKAKELLNKYFWEKATFNKVYYDLSCCQGSGASISFELEYYKRYIEVKKYGRYCHENSFTLEYPNYDYLTDKQEEKLRDKICDMNRELRNFGYDLINYENFIDTAKESLNEKRFLEDGEEFFE